MRGSEWIEVNIAPGSGRTPDERLLIDVIDPLIHERLRGRVDIWFYFWEPLLRLRVHWHPGADVADGHRQMTDYLNAAKRDGRLISWFEGSHGEKGRTYPGEAEGYGVEVWDLTARDWMSGSELALAIVKADAEGRLSRTRRYHYERKRHLYSNQLLVPE